ncbi:unnamed protein product [Ectocarpus fasciculatus]
MLSVRWPTWKCVECRVGAMFQAFECNGVVPCCCCCCCRTPRCPYVACRRSPPTPPPRE